MKKQIKSAVVLAFVLAFVAVTSSCNRGMGCPSNFSIGKIVSGIAK